MSVTNFADAGGWHMSAHGQVGGGKTERWVNPMLFQPFPIDHGRSIHRRRLGGRVHDQRAIARALAVSGGASVYKLEQTDWDSLSNHYIDTHLLKNIGCCMWYNNCSVFGQMAGHVASSFRCKSGEFGLCRSRNEIRIGCDQKARSAAMRLHDSQVATLQEYGD